MHRTVERMLRTSPELPFAPAETLSSCIHACVECAQVCTACADACIGEHARELDRCIRLALDCADICTMAARVLSRQQVPDLTLVALALELCAEASQRCAVECGQHAARFAHVYVCAAARHRCHEACRMMSYPQRFLEQDRPVPRG